MKAFLDRPLECDCSMWLDATYVKVRRNHRIVSVGVIMAVGVNADGRREVLGMDIGRKSTPRMRSTSDFCAGVLFWGCASDLAVKRGASAASAARQPIRSLPD